MDVWLSGAFLGRGGILEGQAGRRYLVLLIQGSFVGPRGGHLWVCVDLVGAYAISGITGALIKEVVLPWRSFKGICVGSSVGSP